MNYNKLADVLYPNVNITVMELEEKYPPRDLSEGAKVTRFAPSPTGFVHFGSLFPTTVDKYLSRQSGGVFYLRIEDTDKKRQVDGAEEDIINSYKQYGIEFDEGISIDGKGDKGNYGPYRQSERAEIYHAFAKKLICQGSAYPCFCSEEELAAIREEQEQLKVTPGYYGKWAKFRDADMETIQKELDAKHPFVLRFRSEGNTENKIKFNDLIKGDIEITENNIDQVLLKSDGIPTYHFAHAVDDHLMRTTHVVRGEEWLPSLPFHIQLFKALGFKLPKYMHLSQLMKKEGDSKKKLSKRDKGTGLGYYISEGYAPECVNEYIMTLLNSNFEEWRSANPEADINDFQFSIKKMSASGCLLDPDKLNDVSKNVISKMPAEKVYSDVLKWAKVYDPEFAESLEADAPFAIQIFSIGRGGSKPRKDIALWSEAKEYMGFFYDKYFKITDNYPEQFDTSDIKSALQKFIEVYDDTDDQDTWFGKIKEIAESLGYAAETKLYKKSPDQYKGHVGDISMFLRIAVTGKMNSPDMYAVMQILGKYRVSGRITNMIGRLS